MIGGSYAEKVEDAEEEVSARVSQGCEGASEEPSGLADARWDPALAGALFQPDTGVVVSG